MIFEELWLYTRAFFDLSGLKVNSSTVIPSTIVVEWEVIFGCIGFVGCMSYRSFGKTHRPDVKGQIWDHIQKNIRRRQKNPPPGRIILYLETRDPFESKDGLTGIQTLCNEENGGFEHRKPFWPFSAGTEKQPKSTLTSNRSFAEVSRGISVIKPSFESLRAPKSNGRNISTGGTFSPPSAEHYWFSPFGKL